MLYVLQIAFDNFANIWNWSSYARNGLDWTESGRTSSINRMKTIENASITSMIIIYENECVSRSHLSSQQSKLNAQSIFSLAFKSECRSAVVVGTHRDTIALNYIISWIYKSVESNLFTVHARAAPGIIPVNVCTMCARGEFVCVYEERLRWRFKCEKYNFVKTKRHSSNKLEYNSKHSSCEQLISFKNIRCHFIDVAYWLLTYSATYSHTHNRWRGKNVQCVGLWVCVCERVSVEFHRYVHSNWYFLTLFFRLFHRFIKLDFPL